MLSLETAKKLKIAGLRWEPKVGDFAYTDLFDCGFVSEVYVESIVLNDTESNIVYALYREGPRDDVGNLWLPSLSQLLAEIENRGYGWSMWCFGNLKLFKKDGYAEIFKADTLEETAGQALLWILESEGGSNA